MGGGTSALSSVEEDRGSGGRFSIETFETEYFSCDSRRLEYRVVELGFRFMCLSLIAKLWSDSDRLG
jgi:hypothetical protein